MSVRDGFFSARVFTVFCAILLVGGLCLAGAGPAYAVPSSGVGIAEVPPPPPPPPPPVPIPGGGESTGSISGAVSTPGSATPITSVQLVAYHREITTYGYTYWSWQGSSACAANGTWRIANLPVGTYHVWLNDTSNEYVDEYVAGAATHEHAADIQVTVGFETGGINATMTRGGRITGAVTLPGNYTPVWNIYVQPYRWTGWYWDQMDGGGYCSSAATYTIKGLPTGTYRLRFSDWTGEYQTEYYLDAKTVGAGTSIPVTAGGTIAGVNATLDRAGFISGTVSLVGSATLVSNVRVSAYPSGGSWWSWAGSDYCDSQGLYRIAGLTPGSYCLRFEDHSDEYLEEYHQDADSPSEATAVSVSAGASTTVNASLNRAGSIAGAVSLEGTTGLAGAWVSVDVGGTDTLGNYRGGNASCDASGAYRVKGLPTGTYQVGFYPSAPYLREYYDNIHDEQLASDVPVSAGATTTGINAMLELGGSITGTVTLEGGGSPSVVHVGAAVLGEDGWEQRNYDAVCSSIGAYSLTGLPGGTYRVRFKTGGTQYIEEWYADTHDFEAATDVHVTTGSPTPGVNASLAIGGSIHGNVIRDSQNVTGSPTDFAATLYRWNGGYWTSSGYRSCDSTGAYRFDGLPGGRYRVGFTDHTRRYQAEFYADAGDIDAATDVNVATGSPAPGIDVVMVRAGSIGGTVTGDGVPLADADVTLYTYTSSSGYWGWSGAPIAERMTGSGSYVIDGVSSGSYRLRFRHPDYVEAFNGGADSLVDAEDVVVTAPSRTSASIDMVPGGVIQGTVSVSGVATSSFHPYFNAYRWDEWSDAWVQQGGSQDTGWNGTSWSYALRGLAAGAYRVEFQGWDGVSHNMWHTEYYDGRAFDNATTVTVSQGATVSGINAVLTPGGATYVSGRVQASTGATATVPVTLYRVSDGGQFEECGWTFAHDGTYTLAVDDSEPGTYTVRAGGTGQFAATYLGNETSAALATRLVVTPGVPVVNQNISLVRGGSITGALQRPGDLRSPGNVPLVLFDGTGRAEIWSSTNSGGRYRLDGVSPGSHYLVFGTSSGYESGRYLPQFYPSALAPAGASPISVVGTQATTCATQTLQTGAVVRGRVTDSGGAVEWATILGRQWAPWLDGSSEMRDPWNYGRAAYTGFDGRYALRGLWPAQPTQLTASNWGAHVSECYIGAPADQAAVPPTYTPVFGGQTADFLLKRVGSTVKGRVVTASGSTPTRQIRATLWYNVNGAWAQDVDWEVWTGRSGRFEFNPSRELMSGEYRLELSDPTGRYLGTFYGGSANLAGATTFTMAERQLLDLGDIVLRGGGGNTVPVPDGSNVSVPTSIGVDLTIPTVTVPGTLTVTPQPSESEQTTSAPTTEVAGGGTLSATFRIIRGSYYEITMTASYAGTVTVAIPYDPAQIRGNAADLKLFHWKDNGWEDVTWYVDTANHIVYGRVTSLSPFMLAERDVWGPHTTCNAAGPYTSSASIHLAATDEHSAVAYVAWRLNGGVVSTLAGSAADVAAGIGANHTLEYWAVDGNSNVELPHHTAIFTVNAAPSPPPPVYVEPPPVYVAPVVTPSITGHTLYTPVTPSTVYYGRSFTVSSFLKPRHKAGLTQIKYEGYRYEGGKWVRRATWYGKNYNYSTYTKSIKTGAVLKLRGKWRVRAVHSHTGYLPKYSGYRYFTVR